MAMEPPICTVSISKPINDPFWSNRFRQSLWIPRLFDTASWSAKNRGQEYPNFMKNHRIVQKKRSDSFQIIGYFMICPLVNASNKTPIQCPSFQLSTRVSPSLLASVLLYRLQRLHPNCRTAQTPICAWKSGRAAWFRNPSTCLGTSRWQGASAIEDR